MTSARLIGFWVLGGLFMLFGVWILNNLENVIGVSDFSYVFALLVALASFLVTGLFWISVAAATRH